MKIANTLELHHPTIPDSKVLNVLTCSGIVNLATH
nr:hypothetical protein [Pseudoalteromonas piscicida]